MTSQIHKGQRLVYQADESGFYVGEAAADPDPQKPGSWLIPAGCVEVQPPAIPRGKKAKWSDYKWQLISV